MAILINWKICDNSKDCNGPPVCPVKALTWDDKKKTLKIDNSKCISCGACEKACSVGAIHVAKTDEEYKKIKKEIDADPRKVSDLFVDRYGATPIDLPFLGDKNKFEAQVLSSGKPCAVEFFSNKSIRCLVKSIRIKELFEGKDIVYRKMKVDENDALLKKYKISKLPTLAFFKNGKMTGKIEGYYNQENKEELKEKIGKFV